MSDGWCVKRNATVSGPFPVARVRDAIAGGKIRPTDLLSQQKDGPFLSLEEFNDSTASKVEAPPAASARSGKISNASQQLSTDNVLAFLDDSAPSRPNAARSLAGPGANGEWYYSHRGQEYGPVPKATLQQFAISGQLSANDLVWRDGMSEWVPAGSVEGLLPAHAHSGAQTAGNNMRVAASLPAFLGFSQNRLRLNEV
jgi:hypothetical protein